MASAYWVGDITRQINRAKYLKAHKARVDSYETIVDEQHTVVDGKPRLEEYTSSEWLGRRTRRPKNDDGDHSVMDGWE